MEVKETGCLGKIDILKGIGYFEMGCLGEWMQSDG